TWRLGHEGLDNGVLLLVVVNERKLRIEVGYGLEGDLTDASAASIIQNQIAPYFRHGDYAGGVEAGLRAIIARIEGSDVGPTAVETNRRKGSGGGYGFLLFVL